MSRQKGYYMNENTGITPLDPQQTSMQEAQAAKEGYVKRVLVATDMNVNVLFDGHPDETISSRAARAASKNKLWGKILSKVLDVFQSDHGAKAVAGDEERAITVSSIELSSNVIATVNEVKN